MGRGGAAEAGFPAEAPGWRAPHLPQYASAGVTWFPHWLQKGIYCLYTRFSGCLFQNIAAAAMLPSSP
jgi:hypothetical protein